jgi:hypothetical protein
MDDPLTHSARWIMSHTDVPSDDQSKTIKQFCRAEQMSRPQYYNMKKRGRGPRELRDGRFVRITPQSHAEWRRARENDNEDTAT